MSCSNPRNANKTQAKRLLTRGNFVTRASQVVHFWSKSPHLVPLTSTEPLFSSWNITLGTHGSLSADICEPKPCRNRHHWGLLRAQSHCFPRGLLHLAHKAPYGPTFVCPNSLGTTTIGPSYEDKTIVFLQEYYTWHTRLPKGRHL